MAWGQCHEKAAARLLEEGPGSDSWALDGSRVEWQKM